MPIANYKPSTKFPTKPQLPKVAPDDYKGIVVDDKYQSTHSLTAYVEGYPQTITYYGQILGENNDVREIDPAQSGVYQQYTKINQLDIRVESPLEQSYNSDTGLSQIVGVANIYPDIVPNTYDYFTFKTTRGRLALYRITNVTRKSMNRDSVHNVEYQMVGYTDEGDAKTFLDSLESKVKKIYFFHGDRLVEGVSPLLRDEEHHYVENLYKDYQKILDYYFSTFHNHTYQTLVVPGQSQAVYDKYVVDFLFKIISANDHNLISYTKQLGTDQDRFMKQPEFWYAIYKRNALFIEQSNKFMGLVNRATFNRDHYIAGAGLSTIDSYVYPRQIDPSSLLPTDPSPKNPSGLLTDTAGANGNVCSTISGIYSSPTGDVVLYKRVLCDIFYVLSREFYENSDGQSLLEKVTWDYLEGNSIQLSELNALTKAYYKLARLEQFYYGPLLLTLIQASRLAQYG